MRTAHCLVVLTLLASQGILDATGDQTVPFSLSSDGAIVIPVSINGAGPFRFRLDTGSTRTVVSEELTLRLGLARVDTSVVFTPTGRVERPVARVTRFEFGGQRTTLLDAVVQPRGRLFGGTSGVIDGLIGQDVLAARVYTIDYARRQLEFGTAPHPATGRLPLQIGDGTVLVTLPQSTSAGTRRFIPDSGAGDVVLFARRETAPWAVTPLETTLVRTASGQRVARRVRVDALEVGSVSLQNHAAVLVNGDDVDARLGDGLLPLHLFARVTFNGPERYLIVEGRTR
jgi:predicted aspartyl protease